MVRRRNDDSAMHQRLESCCTDLLDFQAVCADREQYLRQAAGAIDDNWRIINGLSVCHHIFEAYRGQHNKFGSEITN